ncbi:gluconokinase [Streptomyces sp. NPDC005507]|uniref:gluconokinase n=1 Tax=Streptomyces sp. NPDC005507 TaxID=3154885 RepID=UPI0033B2CBF6
MSLNAESHSPCIVVAGVSGTGKSTLGRLLADRLGVPFAEADDFHPPGNIAKMSAGVPLDDEDRRPWLESIGHWLRERDANGSGGVIACSALKRRYRSTLRAACPDVYFLQLTASRDLLAERISQRTAHVMPKTLLDSQLAALGPLTPDEPGATLDAGTAPDAITDMVIDLIPWSAIEDRE